MVLTSQERILARRGWSKFGSALQKCNTTVVSNEEVMLEFTTKQDEWVPNGIYITDAIKHGWSNEDIRTIIKSPTPDQAWLEILDRRSGVRTHKDTTSAVQPTTSKPEIGKRSLKDMLSKRQVASQDTRRENSDESTLFLENLPMDYTEDDIKSQLRDLGIETRRVNIVKRDNGDSKESVGKAFVELESPEVVAASLLLIDRCQWDRCIVSAHRSRPKVPKETSDTKQPFEKQHWKGKRH